MMGNKNQELSKKRKSNVFTATLENPLVEEDNLPKERKKYKKSTVKSNLQNIATNSPDDGVEKQPEISFDTSSEQINPLPLENETANELDQTVSSIHETVPLLPKLPLVENTFDDIQQFENLLRLLFSLIKQIKTVETFVHRAELEFILFQLFTSNISGIQNPSFLQLSIDSDLSLLPRFIDFVQTELINNPRMVEFINLKVRFHDKDGPFNRSTNSRISKSALNTNLVFDIEKQFELLCKSYADCSPTLRQRIRGQFETIQQVLLNYKAFFEAILEVKWECLQHMRV